MNSGQEKVMEKVSSQRSEECTQAVASWDQKKWCLWTNGVGAEAYEACRVVVRNGTQEAMNNRSHTQIFRWWRELFS